MNICFSLTNLELGGAQVFVLRLAEEVARLGEHKIWIYDHWPEYRQLQLPAGSRVKLVSYSESRPARWLTWKVNALLRFLGLAKEFRHTLNRIRFEKFLHRGNIQVLNSHALFSDLVIAGIQLPEQCAFVPTLHGEYELILSAAEKDDPRLASLSSLLMQARTIIYTAGKNLLMLDRLRSTALRKRVNVGINPRAMTDRVLRKSDAGLNDQDFVVGMVSRGIPEKGWDLAIRIVQQINSARTHPLYLLLVGEGDYVKDLVTRAGDPHILLRSFGSDVTEYYSCYSLFDLFIFPSTFKGESMPNAVIEAISRNVPVVATRHAELPYMLETDTPQACGICIPVGPSMQQEFAATITTLAEDHARRARLSGNCAGAFRKFDLELIRNEYLNIFADCSAQQLINPSGA